MGLICSSKMAEPVPEEDNEELPISCSLPSHNIWSRKLPITPSSSLLTEKSDSLVLEVDRCPETLEPVEDNAAFNFVNALGDLLWAFELRATASWVFQLAIKRCIYRDGVFSVAEKDWGADFRKLSAGSALVALTLWLDHLQDASLQGSPESPKSVVLITGTSEYNMVSLNSTLKAYLWEMGSPFLP